MNKWLFLDYRQLESVEGFVRRLEPPRRHPEPCLVSDQPWERNALGLYGSVVRRPDGRFQLWYMCGGWSGDSMKLAYAESDDGIEWRRPELDLFPWEGQPTNVVMAGRPVGGAVLYDPDDPRPGWRYKLVCAPEPVRRISAFRSPNGIHWKPAAENPVIGTNPDGPMCLMRLATGRYALLHRPCWGDRRVARSESWDFVHWSEAKVVCEPDDRDETNVQFYGMGAVPYGPYEIGTLWVYHTDADDMGWTKGLGYLDIELTHSRGGYSWHRTAQGTPWIPTAPEPGDFGSGQIHAASQPLLLSDEVRFYYAAAKPRHGEDGRGDGEEPAWAIGVAGCRPDRFVSVSCGEEGRILTRPFWTEDAEFFVNGSVDGQLRAEVTDVHGRPMVGFGLDDCVPVSGDDVRHVIRWNDSPDRLPIANREIRLRIEARAARLYSISVGSREEADSYWRFRLPHFLPMDLERYDRPRL